jgi:hypothetical protein
MTPSKPKEVDKEFLDKWLSVSTFSNVTLNKTWIGETTFYDRRQETKWELEKEILKQVTELRKENKLQYESIIAANLEIKKQNETILRLEKEVSEKTTEINEILHARENTKNLFWVGIGSGIVSGVFGLISSNIFYVLIGGGVSATSLTGLIEAKRNNW